MARALREHALTPDAAGCIIARQSRLPAFIFSTTADRSEWINVERRERDNARCLEAVGRQDRSMSVHCPCKACVLTQAKLLPAMYTLFNKSGKEATNSPSSISQTIVSIFQLPSRACSLASKNRATPTMRLDSTTGLAMRVMVGTTLPPIPRNMMSSFTYPSSSGSQTGGRDIISSSISSNLTISGR